MSLVICQSGKEPGVRDAIDYLMRRYGIPAKEIRAVGVDTEVGSPIRITVTVYQQVEPGFTAEPAVSCVRCLHQAHLHWDEDRPNQEPRCVGSGPGRACPCDRSCQLVNKLDGKDVGESLNHEGSDRWTGGDHKDAP